MKKFFVVLVCMSMLFSLGTINISAAQEEPLSIEKVENTGPTLGIEKTTSDTQLLEIFNGIKDKAPTLSSDGQKIILPAIENEQYNISLYGTSNSAVIREDGKITQPLEDMIVYLYYQVENKDTKESLHMDDPIIVKVNGQYNDGQINRPQVLPGIREWKGNQGTFKFNGNLVIKDNSLKDVASKIAFYIEEMTQTQVSIVSKEIESGDISIELDKSLTVGNEGYTLDIDDSVTVKAPEEKGLLYAGATLSQMFMDNQNLLLPKGLMRDYPQYQVRSTMLDVARFYMPLDYLEEITKYAAFFKLNEIHVHINDDGGEQSTAFRVESKKYPAINSGIPADEVYSQEDYKEYQKEVYQYGVEVVTEIDTPAHCRSINYVDPSIMLDGSHIDLSNPDAVAFMKSLYDEFLDGDDPVFRNQKFNIGTDEYPSGHNEEMRAYMDEMIKYVNSKNIQTRLWSGLNVEGSSYGGKTPVSNEAVFHFWARSFANLGLMLEGEYPMINNIDGYLYIVPAAGYHDYLNIKNLYNTWEAGMISTNEVVKPGHPLMLGSEAALWNDIKVGASEFDIFDRHRDQIMLMAEKNWYGEKTEGQTGDEFMQRVEKFGQYAPTANPARYVKSNSELVANYNFENVENGVIKDLSDNHYDANVVGLKVDSSQKALLLDGKGYVSLPFNSIGYPYTIDFEMMISSSTPANAIMFSGKDGVMYYNYDNTGKIGYQRKGYVYLFDYDVMENVMHHFTMTCSNTDLQLYIDNVLIGNGEYYQVSASKQASSTFVLPVEKVGLGIKGYLKSMSIYNKVKTTEVVPASNLALHKPVTVSGVEGGYNDDGTLVYPQFDPQNATDGDYGNRISLNRDDSAWVQVDLNEICLLENITIHFKEKPGAYKLHVSKDGENWQCIDVQENPGGGTSGKVICKIDQALQARYIKYEQTKMFCATWAGNAYYSGNFSEFEVFGMREEEINDVINLATQALSEVLETESNRIFREVLSSNIDELKLALQEGTYNEVKSMMTIIVQQVDQLYNGNTDVEKTDKARLKELLKEEIDKSMYDSKALKDYDIAKQIGQEIYNDINATQKRVDLAVSQIENAKNNLYMKKFAVVTTNGNPYQDPNTGYIYNVDYAFDNDTSTTYWKNNYQKAGDYVQIMFREPVNLETVRLVSDRDILKYGELQISKDGKTFETLQELQGISDETVTLAQPIDVLGIKVLATKDNDAAWWRLNEVIINSQAIIDKKVLESELNKEAAQELYTSESYQSYLNIKQQAQTVYEKEDVSQKEIDQIIEQLRQAYQSLAVLANKTELQSLVSEVIDQNNYTQESYDAYLECLNEAQELLKQDDISQNNIDIASWNLKEAILKLEKIVVDKSNLEESIQRALEVDGTLYTQESYQNLQTVLAACQSVYEKENATQVEVDEAVTALNEAIEALVDKPVVVETNKVALQIAVDTANTLKTNGALDQVVPVVVIEFDTALENAQTVLADSSVDQITVDSAFYRLANAIHKLGFLQGDKDALEALIAEVEKLVEEDYTTDSWTALQDALDAAKDVMNNDNAMQEEVDEAYNNLKDAMSSLVLRADKTRLQAMYDMVNGLDISKYTEATVANLTDPMANAKAVLENVDATQAEVDGAYEALTRAYLDLRLIPNKDLLQELINKAQTLNVANYTAKTWSVMINALEEAKAALVNEEIDEAGVQVAYENLMAGIKGLEVVKSGDTMASINTGDTTNLLYPLAGLVIASLAFYENKKRRYR